RPGARGQAHLWTGQQRESRQQAADRRVDGFRVLKHGYLLLCPWAADGRGLFEFQVREPGLLGAAAIGRGDRQAEVNGVPQGWIEGDGRARWLKGLAVVRRVLRGDRAAMASELQGDRRL